MDEYDDIISAAIPKKPRRTYDRNQPDEADWSLDRVNELQDFYSSTFKRQLPLSNKGQSSYHNKLGFDHRDSSDISLNPTSAEGQQLMKFMRERNMPFLAFDRAIPGISSGPHIHAGRPSSRTGSKYAPGAQVKSKRIVGDNYDDIIQAAVPQTPATVGEADSYDDVIAAATTSVPISTGRFGAPRAPIKQQRGQRDAFAGVRAGVGGQQQQPPLTGTEDLLNTIGGREKRGEDIQNILEGVTGAVAGTGRQLANAQELGMRVTPIGIAGRELSKRVTGFDPQAIPSKIRDASEYLESAVVENEAARPAPDTFLGNVRRGVGKGVGASVVEMPKLILGGTVLKAANLPVQGALARADEGVSGIVKGAAGGLVYHYGGALTGKAFSGVSPYLAKLGNSLVWIAGPVAEQQLVAKVTGSEPPNLAQSIGENIPFGIMAGMGARGKVRVKTRRGERDATEADLPKILKKELEIVPPERVEDAPVPQRFQHLQFGEVEVTADQSGARRGRLRVAEVGNPDSIHYVKKADLRGRGNERMVPLKDSASQPVEVLPGKPQQPPETEAAQPARAKTTAPSPPETLRVEPELEQLKSRIETSRNRAELNQTIDALGDVQKRVQRQLEATPPSDYETHNRLNKESAKAYELSTLAHKTIGDLAEEGTRQNEQSIANTLNRVVNKRAETARSVGGESLRDQVSALVDERGGLTRGGDVVKDLMKGRSDVEVQDLLQWTREHPSEFVKRFVGGNVAAELRSRSLPPKPETTSVEQGKTIKGDEAQTPRDVPVESRKVSEGAKKSAERLRGKPLFDALDAVKNDQPISNNVREQLLASGHLRVKDGKLQLSDKGYFSREDLRDYYETGVKLKQGIEPSIPAEGQKSFLGATSDEATPTTRGSAKGESEPIPAPTKTRWQDSEQRTPELDKAANRAFQQAQKNVEHIRAERAKAKPTSTGFTRAQIAHDKQLLREQIKQEETVRLARRYSKLPEAIEQPSSSKVVSPTTQAVEKPLAPEPKVSEQPIKEVINEATAQVGRPESTIVGEGAGLGALERGTEPAPSKPELPKVKEAFRLPFIDPAERGNQARLKQSINLEYATESGRQIKKAVTIGKRQKQLENKHSVIGKLLDCLHA